MYTLLGADGRPHSSENRGTLGGNSKLRIYGQLDCWSARNALGKGYEKIRVFFADEETAVAAGYQSLGRGSARRFGGGKAVRQTIVEMESGFLFVTAAGHGACLAVIAAAEADIGVIAYEMAMLVTRVGPYLATPPRTGAHGI